MQLKNNAALLILTTCVLCSWSSAAVIDYSASVTGSITQFQNGSIGLQDQQTSLYPNGSSIPIEVHQDAGVDRTWRAFNRVLANEPQYNAAIPRDFIMESAIGSNARDISLQVQSQASQTRRISLESSEFPLQSPGDRVNLASRFLLDGAFSSIVPNGMASAQGLEINFNLNIRQNQQSLWNGTVRMIGQADGSVAAQTSGDFRDTDFVMVRNEVPDLGTIWLMVFDQTVLPYSYQGDVGESFDLTAMMNVEFAVPGGLGAGSAFGTVPSEMIMLTESLFRGQDFNQPMIASPAPEPTTLILLLAGGVLLGRRRRG